MAIDPQRSAFLFPGQGSQAVGMGRELARADAAAAAVFAEAEAVLGYDLSKLCWEGPAETLNDTQHTQPALLTHSVAVLRALQARASGFRPAFAAGHSLGEFSALVACACLPFADALRLVRERGLAMKSAGEQSPGGMAAILGLDASEVEAVCRQSIERDGGVVQVANDNCPGQVVISGDEQALGQAIEALKASGARKVIRLAVSIASHSPLMQAAQAQLDQALQAAPLAEPQLPLVGNVEARALRSAAEIQSDLRAQLTSRVRWTESVRTMAAAGVETFLELGTGSVLCGLVRRIIPDAATLPLDSIESLQAVTG